MPAAKSWQRTALLRQQREGRPVASSILRPREPRIGDEGLRALENHKYRAGPITPLDEVLYVIWWEPLSRRLPPWLAPNVLTLLGAAAAVSSGVLLVFCSPTLDGGAPCWAELLACALVLFYQTCDALDGLQARRTGASSPLGELFDHGCDGLCLTAFTLGYCVSQQCGLGILTFAALVVSWIPWWLAQWEAYHTGVVRTGAALFGITEIEFVVALIHLITVVFGADIWKMPVPLLSTVLPDAYQLDLRQLCVLIQFFVASVLSAFSIMNVSSATKGWLEKLQAGKRALPMVVLVAVATLWPLLLPGLHSRSACLCVSALFSRLASEIVLAHMTHEEYPKSVPYLVPLPLLLILGKLGLLDSGPLGTLLVGGAAIYCVADALVYAVDVVEEVATHLGVSIVSVKSREE